MPELPDLQAFSHNLNKIFKGKKLDKIEVIVDRKLNVPIKELQQTLSGLEVEKFKREGKELHLLFKGGHALGLHLMLHGQLAVFKDGNTPPKNQIINLLFHDGTNLALTDFQKAATPTLDPKTSNVPDALDADEKYLSEKFSKTKTPVKTVIMDQKIIRGIGNAYADEILWNARISPFSAANKIPKDKVKVLARSIKKVLEHAEEQILTAKPDIISGEIRDFMEVHNPKKKQTSAGTAIHQKELSSRNTYYTDEQELFN
ncbi:MAG: Fpg/Nei family glycosylase [Mucilaginibacter sp.]|nr:Fpg/Nei family glycosylase [Mucilaginibacter sp.]